MRYFTILSAVVLFLISGQIVEAQSVLLKLGDYSISAASSPKKDAGALSAVQTVLPKTAKGMKSFGFWYAENENAMGDVVLEIANAATKAVVRNVTAADLAGKSKTQLMDNGTRVVSTYQFGTGPGMVELQVEAALVNDESAPMGKKVLLSYKTRTAAAPQLNAVLKLKTDGLAQLTGNSSIVTTRMEKDQAAYPAIVLSSLNPVTIDVSPRAKVLQQVAIQAQNIAVKGSEWALLLSLEISGTTVKDAEKANMQAMRVSNRVSTKEAKPDLVIFNSASNTSTVPGDTLTYTISYCNIGNALAQDAEITNPVPDGLILIEKSVETKEADVVIERKPAMAPQAGTPSLVRWKLKKKVLPGEEGKLMMKAIVR